MTVAVSADDCASCGQPVIGRFCPSCGERRLDRDAMTVRHFFTDAIVHELFDLDSRIWRTVRALLFRPGFLSLEYWAGRRRLYVKPVRLFLTAVVIYALATQGGLRSTTTIMNIRISMAPTATAEGVSVEETLGRLDPTGMLASAAARRLPGLARDDERREFHQRLAQFSQPLSFTNVLLLALALYLVFFRRYPLYAQHAVFAMHFMAFVLLTSVLVLVPALQLLIEGYVTAGIWLSLGLTVAQFVYAAVAMRRFYFGHDPRRVVPGLVATAAAFALLIVNSVFTTMIQILGAALALATT